MEKTMKARVQHKHDIEANWLKATNFTPLASEIIVYDSDENYDYPRIKIGDGKTNINSLPFVTKDYAKISDIPTKPEDIGALPDSTIIPTVPTKISAFENDKGYLTQHQSLDAYAKTADLGALATKDSLTASDVGALPDTTKIPSTLSDLTADSTHRTVTDTEKNTWNAKANASDIPTKVSDLTNDKGYITSYTETDPTVPAWAKAATKPSYTASEVGALPSTTKIPSALSDLSEDTTHRVVTDAEKTTWNAKSNFSGSYNDLTNKPTIPSVEGLASTTYVDNAIKNKVDKDGNKVLSTNDYTTAEKNKLANIAAGAEVNVNADWNATSGDAQILNKPTLGSMAAKNSVAKSDLASDVLTSLGKADSALQPSDISDWAKQSSKPSYTKDEIGLSNVDNVKQYSASNPPPYPVTSVNGKTGAVTVDIPNVPTKLSAFENDKGYLTQHQSLAAYSTTAQADAKYQPKGNYLTQHQDISGKLDKNQGSANVGKTLVVGTDGNLTLTYMPSGGGDVIGTLDANNNILLSGNLADGTYTLKYEYEDGTVSNVGSIVVSSIVTYDITRNLTNCTASGATSINTGGTATVTVSADSGYNLPDSITVSGATYTWDKSTGKITLSNPTSNVTITVAAVSTAVTNILTSGDYDIKLNQRWTKSGKAFKTCNGMLTFHIPIADVWNKTVWFKGMDKITTLPGSLTTFWCLLDADSVAICDIDTANPTNKSWGYSTALVKDNGVFSIPINTTSFSGYTSSVAYLVVQFGSDANGTAFTKVPDNWIMTIDEEITSDTPDSPDLPESQQPTNLANPASSDWKTGYRMSYTIGNPEIQYKSVSGSVVTNFVEFQTGDIVTVEGINFTDDNNRQAICKNNGDIDAVSRASELNTYVSIGSVSYNNNRLQFTSVDSSTWCKGRFSGLLTGNASDVKITIQRNGTYL